MLIQLQNLAGNYLRFMYGSGKLSDISNFEFSIIHIIILILNVFIWTL